MSHACCARDGSEREYCARVCSTIEACAHARPRHRHSCICHAYLCVTDAFCTSPRLRQRPASAASAIAGFTTDQSERSGCHGRPAHCAQQVWDENSMWQMRSVPTANDPQITPLLHQRFTALVTRHIRPATAKHQKTPKSNHSAIIEQHPGNIRNASNSCRPGSGKSFMWDAARSGGSPLSATCQLLLRISSAHIAAAQQPLTSFLPVSHMPTSPLPKPNLIPQTHIYCLKRPMEKARAASNSRPAPQTPQCDVSVKPSIRAPASVCGLSRRHFRAQTRGEWSRW